MSIDLDAIRKTWLAEKPRYEVLAKTIKHAISQEMKARGTYADVTHRVKEVDSLLKKAIRKEYLDPYNEITDKAGVRVVVRLNEDVAIATGAIRRLFRVVKEESKLESLHADEFGYLGIHFEVTLNETQENSQEELQKLMCEVQIHTLCQNVWANLSHILAYKTKLDLPKTILRSLHRISALLEMADEGFSSTRSLILDQPMFAEMRILSELEKHYYAYVARPFDTELSIDVIRLLMGCYSQAEQDELDLLMGQFVDQYRQSLTTIFEDYGQVEDRSLFLFQPEAIMIFERLLNNPYSLRETWSDRFPDDELQRMARVWGFSYDS
jgi:ppGpp synthetase/RelA/SpoT-type nucleotidyltranferase